MRVLPPLGNGRAIDVGCGEGYYVRALTDLGWSAWGMEVDEMLAQRAYHLTEGHAWVGEATTLPLESACASLVSLRHVLEHVPAPDRTLAEVRRVLRPGGHLLLEVPNARAFQARVAGPRWLHWDWSRHRWHFHAQSLRHLLQKSGFTHVHVWAWPNAPGWVDTWGLSRRWRWLFWAIDTPFALAGLGGVLRARASVP